MSKQPRSIPKKDIPVFLGVSPERPKKANDLATQKFSKAFDAAIVEACGSKRLDRKIDAEFFEALKARMELYRVDALDALWELANMPTKIVAHNSSLAQIKYMAACRLAGPAPEAPAGGVAPAGESLLELLNKNFHAKSQRIKAIRQQVIEYADDDAPAAAGVTINATPALDAPTPQP